MLKSAVTLDARMTLESALARLEPYSDATDVAIRRREGLKVYWYVFRVEDILDIARRRGDAWLDRSLREALNLRESGACDVYRIGTASRRQLEDAWGVLLEGEEVLGVLEPAPQAAARGRGPRAPSSSRMSETAGDDTGGGGAGRPGGDISAYPHLEAPDAVTADQEFELLVGLSRQQQTGVAGGPLRIPTAERKFDLVVQVVAPPGFQAPEGVRRFLHVERDRLDEAETKIKLVAPATDELLAGFLEVEYSYEGNLLGRAWREIRVAPAGTALPTGGVALGHSPLATAAGPAPDLTVSILEDEDGSGLGWLFSTPHPVDLPGGQVRTRFRHDNAMSFAVKEIKTVADKDGTSFIDNQMRGIGRNISEVMPVEFWEVLGGIWSRVRGEPGDRVPSVLLVSSDPYVPWELASTEDDFVDPALLDAGRPPFLGAQLRLGRWIPPGPRTPRGGQRPELPPSHEIEVKKMAVVVGDYLAVNGQRPLPKAKEEGNRLSARYRAERLSATEEELDALLDNRLEVDGTPASFESVHIACHGEVDLQNPRHNGIVLSDSVVRLSPVIVRGTRIGRVSQPFMFLNACQLGFAESENLADYGGLAGAFLKEGCRGFVAPLWSVDDGVAHDLAVEFYKRTFDQGAEVSEVLRDLRSKFDPSAQAPPATYLAYVFYGHPHLVLSKTD